MAGHHTIDYTSISTPYKELCMKGSGLGYLKSARGLSIEPVTGRIYVVERGNSRIQVFSPEGSHQFMLYPEWAKCGRVDLWGICINDGIIYVSDYQGGRLLLFTLNGEIISIFAKGFTNRKIIRMQQPMGIAINKEGDIYVCEFGLNRILILENDSTNLIHTYCYSSPLCVMLRKGQDESVIGCTGKLIYGKTPLAIESNRVSYKGMWESVCWFGEFDSNDKIIMSDMRGHRILIYDTSNGRPKLLHTIKMTFLGSPMGIAVDRNGKIICVTNSKLYFFGEKTLKLSMFS